MNTYFSPSGNPEVWEEKPPGYMTPEEWSEANPPTPEPGHEPTNEERAAYAKMEADAIIMPMLMRQAANVEEMTDAQMAVMGAAGYFDAWQPGQAYAAGRRLMYGGMVYVVVQTIAMSLEHQPPGAEGMLAVYRPVDAAAGTESDPKTLVPGMDAVAGLFYQYGGKLWKCLRDIAPTFAGRMPGDAGMETFWALAP